MIAMGPNPGMMAYLRARYGSTLVNDTMRVEVHSPAGDVETMVITVLVHRVSLIKRRGYAKRVVEADAL